MTPQERAAVIIFQMQSIPVQERLDALAERLAANLGEGNTKFTVLESYAEEISDPDFVARDMALRIVEGL